MILDKLLDKLSNKNLQYFNKKLLSCFNILPCESGKKYKQCCGK
ncbi:hypothetical protein EGW03_00590 [bacterium]|nr:hypothetical protein [bacterium]